MKRFRWWILALLLLTGLVMALVVGRASEPLEVAFVRAYTVAPGAEHAVVNVSNHSRHDFVLWTSNELPAGSESGAIPPEVLAVEARMGRESLLRAGASGEMVIPVPISRRVKFFGRRRLGATEALLAHWLGKLRIVYPRRASFEKLLEFQPMSFHAHAPEAEIVRSDK